MWVVINKQLDENRRFKSVNACGSIKAIKQLGITIKGRLANYRQLTARLSKRESWSNGIYFIKWCPLTRIKNKKTIKLKK